MPAYGPFDKGNGPVVDESGRIIDQDNCPCCPCETWPPASWPCGGLLENYSLTLAYVGLQSFWIGRHAQDTN
jgi:hypothetical protein